jgi:hypothetical protein
MDQPKFYSSQTGEVLEPTTEGGAWTVLAIDTVTGKVDAQHDLSACEGNVSIFKAMIVRLLEEHVSQYSESVYRMGKQTEENRKINKRPFLVPENHIMPLVGRCAQRLEQAFSKLDQYTGYRTFESLLPYSVSAVFGGTEELDLSRCEPYVNGILYVAFGAEGWAAAAAPVV